MSFYLKALSGNEEGAIFHHLNASRHLLESILASNEASLTKDSRDLEGFAFEVNAYLALVVDIAPFVDAPPARKIPQDSFITSLQYLQKYDTFGAFFSCGYPLFEKISAITLLFNKRLAEEERRVLCSEGITSSYLSLQESILAWKSSPPSHDMERWKSEHLAAGELYRRALLIYLNAALYGSVIDHLKAIGELQEHAEIGLEHIELMWASPYKAIMLWPLMMVGSCLLSKSHRDRIRLDFETDASDLIHVRKACKLITWLWEHKDRRAYGPFGLHFVMEERGVHYCLA